MSYFAFFFAGLAWREFGSKKEPFHPRGNVATDRKVTLGQRRRV
jgi:hypothetical protein